MNSSREAFLNRVRQAVAEGNRAGAVPPLPQRGTVGYQGAGPNPVAWLREALTTAGAQLHVVADEASAVEQVRQLVDQHVGRRVLIGSSPFLDKLDLHRELQGPFSVERVADLSFDEQKVAFFAADIGISGVEFVVAETGSLALASRPDQPRAVSLLVPIHIAVAWREQLTPDLFDLFATVSPAGLPSCLTLITGPSKTGDIELRLVTGVHGPGVVHLVLIGA